MEQDLKLRGLSPATRRNYLLYCRRFAAFFMRSPEELGAAEVRTFLLHQIEVEQLAYVIVHVHTDAAVDGHVGFIRQLVSIKRLYKHCECWAAARRRAPIMVRITTGVFALPPNMYLNLAAWLKI